MGMRSWCFLWRGRGPVARESDTPDATTSSELDKMEIASGAQVGRSSSVQWLWPVIVLIAEELLGPIELPAVGCLPALFTSDSYVGYGECWWLVGKSIPMDRVPVEPSVFASC